MKSKHRKILSELCGICNDIGGTLDPTATNTMKYIDRQKAHMFVSKIIYGILCDNNENGSRELDIELIEDYLNKLRAIRNKQYNDKNGNY